MTDPVNELAQRFDERQPIPQESPSDGPQGSDKKLSNWYNAITIIAPAMDPMKSPTNHAMVRRREATVMAEEHLVRFRKREANNTATPGNAPHTTLPRMCFGVSSPQLAKQ
jgi:hypothetical protein